MPFPWRKKTRVTRISRIVADLQQPKRGGSLVVQTGFPTSLVDLFVKNRSRFARPKPKKPTRPEIPDPPPPPPSPATTPPPQLPIPSAEPPSILENASVADDPASLGLGGECESGSGHRVVGVAVRILVMAVSIASVNRLTVGITVSAFALLLLEYAAKRIVSCSWPRSNVAAESPARSASYARDLFQTLLFQLKPKKKKEPVAELANFQVQLRPNSSPLGEIEVVETKREEGCCVIGPELGEEVDDGCSKGKSGRISRSSLSFKSKMVKKLVPKKFRGSKKMKESEVSMSFEIEEEETRDVFGKQGEENNNRNSNKRSQSLVKKYELECKMDEDVVDIGITGSEESSSLVVIGGVGNSGYKILLVITLAGLVIGRFPALILIMGWCFLLKIVKALWRSQNQGVPPTL